MKVVVTGSIAYDYLMSFPGRFAEVIMPDQLQNLSLSFLVDSMKRQPGGNAPNIAYTMALLGANPLTLPPASRTETAPCSARPDTLTCTGAMECTGA